MTRLIPIFLLMAASAWGGCAKWTTVRVGGLSVPICSLWADTGTTAPPATCAIGQRYIRTDTNTAYTCTSANTWTAGGSAGLTGPAGPAGPIGPAGPAGVDGAPGVPGYSPNSLQSGGGVAWTSGLAFTVSAATYIINNTQYTSEQTDLTLSAADATNPRIDVIAVNSAGAAVVIEGTPAESPVQPDVDPASQLQLTWVYVAATATEPSNVTLSDIYHENTEWTSSRSGTTITLASTNNPHAGTVDVEATNATTGNYVRLQAPAPFDPATRNTLVFYIRSKASWASTRSLQLTLRSAGTQRGSVVVLNQNAFGFDSSNTTTYQQITIPLALFAANGLSVNQLQIAVAGSGTNLGWYIDDITMQGGVVSAGAPSAMTWTGGTGAWQSTRNYAPNEVVTYGGTSYVARVSNTNSTPSAANANWAQMVAAMVGDSGSGGTQGLVPAPATGDAAAGKVLGAGGTWVAPGTSVPDMTGNSGKYLTNNGSAASWGDVGAVSISTNSWLSSYTVGGTTTYFGPLWVLTAPPAAATWTGVNLGGSTVTDVPGGLALQPQYATGPFQVRALVRAQPDTPYTITVKLANVINNDGHCGIGWRESGTGKLLALASTALDLLLIPFPSTSSASAAVVTQVSNPGSSVWMRLVHSSTQLSAYISPDGSNFYQLGATRALTDDFTTAPDQVMFYGLDSNASGKLHVCTLQSWKEE